MIRFAKIVSFVFNPVTPFFFIPFFVVYKQTHSFWYALKWDLFSSMFICGALLILFVGRLGGIFSDLDLSKRAERQRFYPVLLFLATIYLLAALFFRGILFPLSIIALGTVMGILIFEFLNYFVKASGHVGVIAALVTSLTLVYGANGFLATVWIIPLVGWSRLVLKKHTIKEILAGGVLGVLIALSTFSMGKYLYTI